MMYGNLFDAEARVAAIYSIDLIGDPESPPRWVEEFAENLDNEYIAAIADEMPELQSVISGDAFSDAKELAQEIAHAWVWAARWGFVTHFEVCLPRYLKGGNGFVSSWGCVALCWVFTDTIEEISGKVLAIATQIHDAAKARAGAA